MRKKNLIWVGQYEHLEKQKKIGNYSVYKFFIFDINIYAAKKVFLTQVSCAFWGRVKLYIT